MVKKWVYRILLLTVLLLIYCSVSGLGSEVVGKLIEGRYWLATKGIGAAIVPNKGDVDVEYGTDGGSSLEKYGLKFGFIFPVYFESLWTWGISKKTYWLVAQYKDGADNKWLIVPFRGNIDFGRGVNGETGPMKIEEFEDQIIPGEQLKLYVVYKFGEKMADNAIRLELANMRAKSQNITNNLALWEVGNFPNKVYGDEEFRTSFNNNVTSLKMEDIMLFTVRAQ